MEYVGIKGSGADYELRIIRETDKAYFLKSWHGKEVWMPKSCFENDGMITERGYDLLISKLEDK